MITENTTETLCDKRQELVNMLTKAMSDRNLNFLATNSGDIEYPYTSSNNGGYHKIIFNDSGDLEATIGEEGDGSYFCNDFRHWIASPTVDQVIDFIESWDDIVLAFQEFDQKVSDLVAKEFAEI